MKGTRMPSKDSFDVQPAVRSQKIAVIGSGYISLTLSASLALLGHEVECTDKSLRTCRTTRARSVPIVEEGLTQVSNRCSRPGGCGSARTIGSPPNARNSIFCACPLRWGGDGWADLSFIQQVADEIGPQLRPGAVVITKSTVPVGTGEMVVGALGRDDVHVVANPEFLAEGTAMRGLPASDRIVVGAASEAVARNVADLYGPFAHCRSVLTDVASAEMIKYRIPQTRTSPFASRSPTR